jgi:hypothetical protein
MDQNEQQADEQSSEQSAGTSESATEQNEGEQESQETQQPEGSTSLTPEAQKTVDNAIGRQHAKFREQQQRADVLEAELQRVRAQVPQQQRPDIPDAPDPLDDNFDQQLGVRDEAIRERAAFDVRQEVTIAQQTAAANQAQATQQADLNQSAQTYGKRAQDLGLDAAELQVAAQTVAAYGVSDELVVHILNDEQGPLITRYLAGNLVELEALSGMAPMQAAVHLATKIVPKMTAVPTNSGAPPPSDGLAGGGVPPAERGPEGTTYS